MFLHLSLHQYVSHQHHYSEYMGCYLYLDWKNHELPEFVLDLDSEDDVSFENTLEYVR